HAARPSQPRAAGRRRGALDPADVAVENRELGENREQADVAGARQQRLQLGGLGREIDLRTIERLLLGAGKERRRNETFRLGDEIHVVDVAGEVEVGTARLTVRYRAGQRCEIVSHRGRHAFLLRAEGLDYAPHLLYRQRGKRDPTLLAGVSRGEMFGAPYPSPSGP